MSVMLADLETSADLRSLSDQELENVTGGNLAAACIAGALAVAAIGAIHEMYRGVGTGAGVTNTRDGGDVHGPREE
jgi:lactobin A/cerein 7B family class IIb bacteriocin